MIRDPKRWRQFEAAWQRRAEADLEANLRVFHTLLRHARSLGVWPPKDPLEGLEVDLRLARMVNTYVEQPARSAGSGAG